MKRPRFCDKHGDQSTKIKFAVVVEYDNGEEDQDGVFDTAKEAYKVAKSLATGLEPEIVAVYVFEACPSELSEFYTFNPHGYDYLEAWIMGK